MFYVFGRVLFQNTTLLDYSHNMVLQSKIFSIGVVGEEYVKPWIIPFRKAVLHHILMTIYAEVCAELYFTTRSNGYTLYGFRSACGDTIMVLATTYRASTICGDYGVGDYHTTVNSAICGWQ